MKKRIAFRVMAAIMLLGLIGALVGDLVVRRGPFGGWLDIAGDTACILVWGLMLANVRLTYLNRTRWQYAADIWRKVANDREATWRKHFAAEHPEAPAPTMLWPRCALEADDSEGAQ